MIFELSAEQRLLRATTASYLEKASSISVTRELNEAGQTFDRKVWRQGAEFGWTSMLVPESLGGGTVSGAGVVDAMIMAEEFGRAVAPGPFLPVNVVAAALAEASNAEAHRDLIAQLVSGESIAAWAGGAPNQGCDLAAAAVPAAQEGDGYLLVGAHETVEGGVDADVFLVLARTDAGLAQFVVPRSTPGLSVETQASIDFTRQFGRVVYDGVRVAGTAQVGAEGGAASAIQRQFELAVVLQCAELVGVMGRVLEFTKEWLFDRHTFGRPLASYQALKHRFADLTLWSHAAEASVAAAASAVQSRSEDAAELVSIGKSYAGQRATDIIQDCVQLHGGLGITWEHDIHLYLRRATVDRCTWGTPSDHRRRIADLLNV